MARSVSRIASSSGAALVGDDGGVPVDGAAGARGADPVGDLDQPLTTSVALRMSPRANSANM